VRIEEMLELPLLKNAGVKVLAGEDQLHRTVRWVHAGEIADIARFLTGGEVLLTAATGLGDGERSRRKYIGDLGQVGVAAVIFELGRALRAIPKEMLNEARKHDLVLATLDREVPFAAVTHEVHTRLVNATHAASVRAMEIDDALNQLILDGAPLPAVLELLSERLQNPVVLEDAGHRVVSFGRASGSFTEVLRRWQSHSREAHRAVEGSSVHIADSEPRCAWTTVALRGEIWGRLHVLEGDSPLDDVVRLALARAAASIALLLMAERHAYVSEAAEDALVRGMASINDFMATDFTDRAAGLGVDLEGDLVVLAATTAGASPPDNEDWHAHAAQDVRSALADAGWPAVVGSIEDSVVAVAKAGAKLRADAAGFAARLAATGAYRVGVSRVCRASALPRAFQEARMAARVTPPGDDSNAQLFDDLALLRLLAPLAAGPELATFVEGEIGELIAYDEQHNSYLVKTLEEFLQVNGNKQQMCSLLYLRRRSVYYRLERIEQLLGYSLDLPDRRARLYVALRGHELLEQNGTPSLSGTRPAPRRRDLPRRQPAPERATLP
jgi:purine catabolism regulator